MSQAGEITLRAVTDEYVEQSENAIKVLRKENRALKTENDSLGDQLQEQGHLLKKYKEGKEAYVKNFNLANDWRNRHWDDSNLLDKVREQELLTRAYYEKLRDENPAVAAFYLDVIRHCNGILNLIKEKK